MSFGQRFQSLFVKCNVWPFILENVCVTDTLYSPFHSETLYEDEKFPARQLAALVSSKVYYHLNEFDESLQFALGAGTLFDVNKKDDEYINKIIGRFKIYVR